MVFHVGYDGNGGEVDVYDTTTAEVKRFNVQRFGIHGIKFDVESIFENILSKIDGKELGCFCGVFSYCKNDIRKRLIECGLKSDFKKVAIVDPWTSWYSSLALQTKYKPKNGDFVWIVIDGECNIWKKENDYAKFVLNFDFSIETNFKVLFSEIKWKPSAIFFNSKDSKFDSKIAKKLFKSCFFDSLSFKDCAYSATITARIMANDPAVIEWNVHKLLCHDILIKQGEETILKIEEMQTLPITKTFKLKNATDPIFSLMSLGVKFSIWPFSITHQNNKILIHVTKVNKATKVKPEEVSASLLKFIKEKCEKFQGKSLSKVVITIPAVFTESQKEATEKAAKVAGWKTVHLLPEPVAAAFAYFIDRPIPNQSIILLFDLGGGTLDVCISKIENNEIQIISQNGDSQLGGRDFDKILINYFKNILVSDFGISMEKNTFKLMIECQKLKESLSGVEIACLDVEDFDSTKEGVLNLRRVEFEKMTSSLLARTRNTINGALFAVKLEPSHIDKVLLAGGLSRMPMIQSLLKEIFPSSEHCCETNPDEVVSAGAAYYAYTLFSSYVNK